MNGRKIEYVLDAGGTILAEKYDTFTVRYLFNETGTRIGFAFTTGTGSSPYYYVFNGQGDVIGLRSASGTVVAKYAYDAWGKLLSVTDAIGNAIPESNWSHAAYLNSFRYRGYYYDVESGLYFLNTRSYDPETGRFINAVILFEKVVMKKYSILL